MSGLTIEAPSGLWSERPRSVRQRLASLVRVVVGDGDPWEPHVPMWVANAYARIDAAGDLHDDWDGAGAPPVTDDALLMALRVLSETMAPDSMAPQVVPVSDGGLQLEWHSGGVDLEVYVTHDGQVSAWCKEGLREWVEDNYPRLRLGKELSLLTATPGG